MATRYANQRGASLVELMIAALIGVSALGTIGAVFISGQKLVSEQSKQLLLEQNLASVMLQLKEDLQRAGFDDTAHTSAKLSGVDSTLYIENDPAVLGYTYRIAPSGQEAFVNVVLKHDPVREPQMGNGLKICEKRSARPLTVSLAKQSGYSGYCYHLLNPRQISVREFIIQADKVSGEQTSRQMVTLSITGELVADHRISYQSQLTLLLRNGQ